MPKIKPTHGQILIFGTGGELDTNGLEDVFYNPDSRVDKPFVNYFTPSYNTGYDEYGNK
jgi:hypothetical protein